MISHSAGRCWVVWPLVLAAAAMGEGLVEAPAGKRELVDNSEAVKYRLKQACDVSISGGRIIVATKLPQTELVERPVVIEEWPGKSTYSLRQEIMFRIENRRPQADGSTFMIRVERRPWYMQIMRISREGTVVVWQAGDQANAVNQMRSGELRITIVSKVAAAPQSYTATNLKAFRQAQPAIAKKYLLPMLRDLHALESGGMEERIARQVLAQPKPADEVQQTVAKLVKQLDADSPAERQAAAKALYNMSNESTPILQRLDRRTLSPEQQSAIDALLHMSQGLSRADIDRLAKDPEFLVDCLYCPAQEVRELALARLRELVGLSLTHDAKAEPDAEAIEALRDKIEEARKLSGR